MRISDWSSDVCSSDLLLSRLFRHPRPAYGPGMIIAVDGPAASGKGTIARALAHRYKLPHLDTGLLYRAVAATVLQHDLDPGIEADAVASCGFDDLLPQIGRTSCRDRGCQYVLISVVAVSLKNK